jgi:hypothetical protein
VIAMEEFHLRRGTGLGHERGASFPSRAVLSDDTEQEFGLGGQAVVIDCGSIVLHGNHGCAVGRNRTRTGLESLKNWRRKYKALPTIMTAAASLLSAPQGHRSPNH